MSQAIARTLDALVEHDPTVALAPRARERFLGRRLPRRQFSREDLFRRMARGEAAFYCDYPFAHGPALHRGRPYERERVVAALSSSRSRFGYSLRSGRHGRYETRTLSEIMERWRRGRSIMSITDLHIRDSRFERLVDAGAMNGFNLLRRASNEAARLEMRTGVLSTRYNVTDSHSDDPDGSNHCFVGRKLWLFWDTFEGLEHGLEDVERVDVYGERAAFDMETFASLPSARWFVIGPGDTVFLPGRFTHKVITLEDYIGAGGFYVALPNALQSLSRWILEGPLWERNEPTRDLRGLIGQIARAATARARALVEAPARAREGWGYDFLQFSAQAWRRQFDAEQRERLLDDERFEGVLEVAR